MTSFFLLQCYIWSSGRNKVIHLKKIQFLSWGFLFADMYFHTSVSFWSFIEVSKTLLSTLANLSNTLIWMVSIFPLIFNFSNPFSKFIRTDLGAPTTISIIVTIIFFSFSVLYLGPIICISFCFISFHFHLVVRCNSKIHKPISFLFVVDLH